VLEGALHSLPKLSVFIGCFCSARDAVAEMQVRHQINFKKCISEKKFLAYEALPQTPLYPIPNPVEWF